MTRLAARGRVHLWEEPIFDTVAEPTLSRASSSGVTVLTPLLPHGLDEQAVIDTQRKLLDLYLAEENIARFIAWYYTPMALRFSAHLTPALTVYDCMDELSAFNGAPPELIDQEQLLFARANVVFTGGASLYESKRHQHRNVHLFASSIDRRHFEVARNSPADPPDQADIPRPRIGFYGVLDERLDRCLLQQVADQNPGWHFVLIGPVVKIREQDLPRASNIHWLGGKDYAQLPAYLGNWDVAMLPFALNAATRFISPTKTPEYLAAGKPVVSTPIRDVVKPYGEEGLVEIAADPKVFAEAVAICLEARNEEWHAKVEIFLAGNSWDKTFERMWAQIDRCLTDESEPSAAVKIEPRSGVYV